MTTIAYRNGVLAGDTMSTRGWTAFPSGVTKIERGRDGTLGGGCGTASFCAEWRRWIRGERSEKPEPGLRGEDTDTGLLIRPDGTIEVHEPGGFFVYEGDYYAMGSGCDQALGAMFAGADAEMAVRAAIQHDVNTGGEITVLRCEPEPRPKAPIGGIRPQMSDAMVRALAAKPRKES